MHKQPSSQQEQEQEWVSKTRRKQEMHDLQDLGMQLARLSADTLKKIELPEELREAIAMYRKIHSNGALKRQTQYIGRLMRDLDPAPIREFLDKLQGSHAAYNAFLQRVEQMRETLLEHDDALTDFLRDYPAAEAGQLRTLIRNTRKEREQAKPPKHFRALYRYLKEIMEADHPTAEMPAAEGEEEQGGALE
ncbi:MULTISPECIES: ribosome biogenesis factor YjgA [Eikenella]|nr:MULTISPECIES: ribosome biogenesis factor YjgA [Eikenella]